MKVPAPLHAFTELEPAWYGAAAAVAGALAVLVPGHRLAAGAAGGIVVLLIAVARRKPCCAACAGTSTSSSSATDADPVDAERPSFDFRQFFEGAGIMQPRGCTGGGC